MIKAIAPGHIVGVLLGKRVQLRAVGMRQAGAETAEQRQRYAEQNDADRHGVSISLCPDYRRASQRARCDDGVRYFAHDFAEIASPASVSGR